MFLVREAGGGFYLSRRHKDLFIFDVPFINNVIKIKLKYNLFYLSVGTCLLMDD